MNPTKSEDHRRAIAERNVEAILDAAERLLGRRAQPSISAVAAEAGVSRPTVYAHFEDRERLLEALVERAVRNATAALEASEPERGPAMEALQRLVASSWQEIGHNEDIGRASAAELSAEAMRRAHESARAVLARLVERGRREGAFRTDVPAGWLVTSALALIHAAAEAVREGELDTESALTVLTGSVVSLFSA
ncbi:MAG TPA: TetR family transcriptional regulator [Thermoleophilaceae bacterium]